MSEVNKPESKGYMLSFDIKPGILMPENFEKELGYLKDGYGALNIIENNTVIGGISSFGLSSQGSVDNPTIYMVMEMKFPQENENAIIELSEKKLDITVDDVVYHIGSGIIVASSITLGFTYTNASGTDVMKLFAVMEREQIGETKRFYLNWS
ncbi:hypothetical protein PSI23_11535 [Xenorhabdus sp. XENO-10]|uniref:DUF7823 domain-containing protein n=1 Tax=Xenorhabdus yunnanensis TaxID=3025878 RepID=A0ABT5LG12_9GAMM|nr:hypothetical protein [Xenorhabdus yunnanensis]MDC9589914.1 hypothetical protein [Xenorhabdus yunnanensis]